MNRAVSFYLEYQIKRAANEKTAHRSSTMSISHSVLAVQKPEEIQYEFNGRIPKLRRLKNDPRRIIADILLQIQAQVGGIGSGEYEVNWGYRNVLPRLLIEDKAFKKACELILSHYGNSATISFVIYAGLPYKPFTSIPCGFNVNLENYRFIELEEAEKILGNNSEKDNEKVGT